MVVTTTEQELGGRLTPGLSGHGGHSPSTDTVTSNQLTARFTGTALSPSLRWARLHPILSPPFLFLSSSLLSGKERRQPPTPLLFTLHGWKLLDSPRVAYGSRISPHAAGRPTPAGHGDVG